MVIRVSNTINVDDLFNELGGIDKRQSAENLIEQTSAAWRDYLEKQFPGAEIDIRMRLNNAERTSPNLVFVEFGDPVEYEIRSNVSAQLNEIALEVFVRSGWMVRMTG